jgi:hypothetical protein
MADSSSNELPLTRSEYIPPRTIPPAANHATIPDERVHIAGQSDRRQAKTVFSKRAARRASRGALWSLIAAAAFGAALAALLFVRHFGQQASPAKERSGVTTLEPNPETRQAAASTAPLLDSPQNSSVPVAAVPEVGPAQTPPSEAAPVRASSETTAPQAPKAGEGSASRQPMEAAPSHSALPQDGVDTPPNVASAGTNKAWLKPPRRKAWLD